MECTEINTCQELEQRLQFETLLADISTQFINLPSDQIDNVIEESQRSICECLAIDLSALWQWSAESPRFLTVTHLYTIPGGPARPDRIEAQKSFPWVFNKMLAGETLVLSTQDMSPEAAIDQESRRFFGVKSSVVIPLSAGAGPLIGVLTFDTLKEERDWSVKTVERLKLVGQIFCNALVRKESDRALRESEDRCNLAAESAEAGLWDLDFSTNIFWATDRARMIFGYDQDESISMQRFEQSVHPDDLLRVRQAITQSLDRKEPLNVEYRIQNSDECTKWIHSFGRPSFKPDGEHDRLRGVSIDITGRKEIERELREREESLSKSRKDLQVLAGRLISVKEQELRRLSRELHDDLTQRLAVLAIEAGKLELQLNRNDQHTPESILASRFKEQLIKISGDVHSISRQLHPTILDDLGLVRAMESEFAALGQREDIKISFTHRDIPDRLPEDVPLCIYRIAQEGMKNIISHSGAKQCEVTLKGSKKTICLTVTDEGPGFDPVEVKNKPGLGLVSMRERAQIVQGDFSIETGPGRGTSIRVSIPLEEPEI